MTPMKHHGPAKLRLVLQSGAHPVPGAFNAFSARMIERAGFQAVYLSGAGLSASRAFPDIGLLTMTEVVEEARRIIQTVSLPLIADADTGFGDGQQVYRTVRELEDVGVAGIQIEDQTFPKRCGHLVGKQTIDSRAMCRKIRAAVDAKQNPDLLIIARTDARATEGLDSAIRRAVAYHHAGADAIFPEALETPEEFQRFAQAFEQDSVPLIANMTEWGKTPLHAVSEFGAWGYHLILFPMTGFRVMAKALDSTLQELHAAGTQRGFLDRMQSRNELYEVLGYADYDTREAQWDTPEGESDHA